MTKTKRKKARKIKAPGSYSGIDKIYLLPTTVSSGGAMLPERKGLTTGESKAEILKVSRRIEKSHFDILVSIVLPIYNQERWLEQCLESILIQFKSNMELILVDDGSTDSTPQILKKYSEIPGVLVIHQENGGPAVARNTGLKIAKGKWISFIDPDDYIEAGYFDSLLAETIKLGKNDTEIDIISCSYRALDNNKLIEHHFYDHEFDAETVEEKKLLFNQLLDSAYGSPDGGTAIGVPWGKLYRRSMIVDNGVLFNPKLRRMQDNVFNMHAFFYAKCIRYIDRCLYVYRMEHIRLFGKKYNYYAYENYRALTMERKKFFESVQFFYDSEIERNYHRAICSAASTVINLTVAAGDKSVSEEGKRTFRLLMVDENFDEAMAYLQNDKVASFRERVKYRLLNTRSYMLLSYMYKFKRRISRMKEKYKQ